MVIEKESRKIRVLLVDDNQAFLDAATGFLQRHHELVVVSAVLGGEEALAQAQNLRPQVVLMDLEMPGLTGLEAIPRLRAMLPEVGIIALTMLSGDIYRQAALAAGADDFAPKATLTTDLLPAIRRVMRANGLRKSRKGNGRMARIISNQIRAIRVSKLSDSEIR